MNKIMVLNGGSPAMHKLGNIGRKNDNYIRVHDETDEYYVGNFEEGFKFIDVKFNKSDCRNLSLDEVNDLNGKWYSVNGQLLGQLCIDNKGNLVSKNN